MDDSSMMLMKDAVDRFMDKSASLNILDVGSYDVNGSYRKLFDAPNWNYTGMDVSGGPNVDVVVGDDYNWSVLESERYDVIISGQALEHMNQPWLAAKEIFRLCKRGGIIVIIAPGQCRFHEHPIDCFRFWPDGMRGLFVKLAGFEEVECDKFRVKRKQLIELLLVRFMKKFHTRFIGRKP
jgi:SAM-dependent methyltransferase